MLREFTPISDTEARLMNPLQLAYAGDTVWELLIRSRLALRKLKVVNMHRMAIAGVNAGAQAMALQRIEDRLTAEEADIVRRGRNAHPKHAAPKHQDPADYQAATALEALFGYFYLTGQDERMLALFDLAYEEGQPCPAQR